ncbi:MAG: hypothetical protein IJD79_07095 [Clostridia bacterium]|nr:hypothetical protein [Clostridia bacterium]
MVKYVYDAWGVCTTVVIDESATDIANLNPFRYRSYYLDTGLNLYAYCLNNPVMHLDETGCFAKGLLFQFAVSALCYVGFFIAAIWDKDVKSDMDKLGKLFGDSKNEFLSSIPNIINTKEDIVLNSKKVSFYKGIPVVRTDFEGTFSFGAIVLSRGYTDDLNIFHVESDPKVVKHEYGHNIQLMTIGLRNYIFGIAIPSVLASVVLYEIYMNSSMLKKTYYKIYFSFPWERSADLFGGATHPDYYKNSKEISLIYYALLLLI